MSLMDSMKKEIAKSGGSKGKILFLKEGKRRIRFLKDFEDGVEVLFHDSFAKGVNAICGKEVGVKCELCGNEDLRHRKNYSWPIWDYDSGEVKIFLYAVNNATPIPALISMYETYGTITDRDYVLERKGKSTQTSYTLVPMDKAKFRSSAESKVPTSKAIISLIAKAFPPGSEDDLEDEETENEVIEYTEMTPKELYKLCEQRQIECEPKMKAEYYINLLEEYDDEGEEEDEW